MKTLLAVAALAIAFATPAVEARATQHHGNSQVSAGAHARSAAKTATHVTAKKATKAKHKKAHKKGHKKAA